MINVTRFDHLSAPLSIAIKVTVVLALVAIAQMVLGKRVSAATRHHLWAGSIFALLAIPVMSQSLPGWELPFERAIRSSAAAPEQPPLIASVDADVLPLLEVPSSGNDLAIPTVGSIVRAPIPRLPWASLLVVAYILGVMVLLGRMAIERMTIARLSSRALDVTDPVWERLCRCLARVMGIRGRVRLISSSDVAMPMTWGIRRPVIAIPAAAEQWSDDRRRAVLLHELAHVARGDALTQTLASLATALYWPHPGVWWAARHLRKERELACDDRVLRAGAEPEEYAGHLLAIARSLRPQRLEVMGLAMARPSQLEGRLLAILDERRPRSLPRRRTRLFAGVAVGLVSTGVATAGAPHPEASASLAADLASLETDRLPESDLFDKARVVNEAWARIDALSGSIDPPAGLAGPSQQQQDTSQRILVSRDGRSRLVLGSAVRVERATDGGASRAVDLVIPLMAVQDILYRDGNLTLTTNVANDLGMGPGGVLRLDGFDADPVEVEVFVRALRTRAARATALLQASPEAAALRDGLQSIRDELEARRRAQEETAQVLRMRAEEMRATSRTDAAEAEAALRRARFADEVGLATSANQQQYNDVLRAIDGARLAAERASIASGQERQDLSEQLAEVEAGLREARLRLAAELASLRGLEQLPAEQQARQHDVYDIHRALVENWMAREARLGSEPRAETRAAYLEVLRAWSALEARRASVSGMTALAETPEARAFTAAVRAFVTAGEETP